MAKTAKVENYTAELTAKVVAEYKAGSTVADIAAAVGKSTRSIVAKLSREGVYEKKVYAAKDGSKVESKADIVATIAAKLGVPADDVGSLEAATKAVLKLVADALPAVAE